MKWLFTLFLLFLSCTLLQYSSYYNFRVASNMIGGNDKSISFKNNLLFGNCDFSWYAIVKQADSTFRVVCVYVLKGPILESVDTLFPVFDPHKKNELIKFQGKQCKLYFNGDDIILQVETSSKQFEMVLRSEQKTNVSPFWQRRLICILDNQITHEINSMLILNNCP